MSDTETLPTHWKIKGFLTLLGDKLRKNPVFLLRAAKIASQKALQQTVGKKYHDDMKASRRKAWKWQRLAEHDDLTGIWKRAYLEKKLDKVIQSANKGHWDDKVVSLFIIDLDNFKDFNTKHGHLGGDEALKAVVAGLTKAVRTEEPGIREGDIVARWAGDEFAILVIGKEPPHVYQIADRIQKNLGVYSRTHEEIPITFGVNAFTGKEIRKMGLSVQALTEKSDALLSLGKKEYGRNCGVVKIGTWGDKTIVRPKSKTVSAPVPALIG